MTLKKIYLPEQCYFITSNTLNNEWVFGKLENGIYLSNDKLCLIIIDVLDSLRKELNFLLQGYVIMPYHLHLIIQTAEDKSSATRVKTNTQRSFGNHAKNEFLATRFSNNNDSSRVGENSFSPDSNISQIMKLIKGRSARIVNGLLNKSGQLWQHSFYEHCIRNEQDFIEKINYIHFNPIRASLTQDPANFRYSSYRNYYLNNDSIIKIDRFDL